MLTSRFAWLIGALFTTLCFAAQNSAQAVEPAADGAPAAKAAMAAFRFPAGMQVELFAADPQVGNPVAIGIDERGRLFVAEEYRFNRGTEENRTRPFLLEDDLQLQTTDDRLAMFRKFADKFDGGMSWFSKYSDQIRVLEDRDGDGRADRSQVFADGFNGPLDGLAAGVMARDGDVYFTCIPHLWRLRDRDGDGKADEREALLSGFGVNAAFLGHDLHGMVWGPDGRLYFSIGDRGYHVMTREGQTLHGPRNGAVFRCEADGSHLEVVHRGLRNPQELAFDEFGNLFADDNNCDKGDSARLVYVVEGGDSGWNMAFQTLATPYLTGPWHAEKMWSLADKQQPAWIVPPVGHLGAGPSGFAYYPGVGLADRYRGHFFMCNYTGNGGIESFAVQPQGAGFSIVDYHDFLKPLKSTDVEFGYDGKIYVSEFPTLNWSGAGSAGRVYTLFDRAKLDDPSVKQTRQLFAEGFEQRSPEKLAKLLGHADMRVRQRAQFALADRGGDAVEVFRELLDARNAKIVRLHAMWGLWQIGRKTPERFKHLEPLLNDQDDEVRAQAAKIVGDGRWHPAAERLIALLKDPSPRVQFFAAQSLGQLKHAPAVESLVVLVRDNDNRDAYLRHAAIHALANIGDTAGLLSHERDLSSAVRLAVVLALRKLNDPRVSRFLDDADIAVATEAARAINDLPLDSETAALAQRLSRATAQVESEPLVRRAIHAHFRLGTADNVRALATFVTDQKQSLTMRAEALAALGDWSTPAQRDRVTGYWRPLAKRDPSVVREAMESYVPALLSSTTGDLQVAAIQLIVRLDIKTDDATFLTWATDRSRDVKTRVEALRLLAARKHAELPRVVDAVLDDPAAALRAEGRHVLASLAPERAIKLLETIALNDAAELVERQRAFATLAGLKLPQVETVLNDWAERLATGKVPAELQLDVQEACEQRTNSTIFKALERFKQSWPLKDRQAKFSVSLVGGDAERGQALFVGSSTAQCIRCHKVRGEGGTAAPDLTEVAKRHPRADLLQSLLDPNAKIAKGYGTVTLVLDNGTIVAGVLKDEDATHVTIETPEKKVVKVPLNQIDDRSSPTSAMPSVERALTAREVRDLVAFLSTLK
jgi:quinoprotein glucose dehydrogenase